MPDMNPYEHLEYHEPSGIWVRSNPEWKQQDLDVIGEVLSNDGYRVRDWPRGPAGEIVVDIGSHIGAFSAVWHRKNPLARIVCVEVCPENIPCLTANVGSFATIIQAACTYESGNVRLLNSVKAGGTATGGSTILAERESTEGAATWGHLYWLDSRPIRKVTLEEIMRRLDVDRIDLLKLDCEGSEFSIIAHTPSLDRIGCVVGEYHGEDRWRQFWPLRFDGWLYSEPHTAGGLGIFQLLNPKRH